MLETYCPAPAWTVPGSFFVEPMLWPPRLGNTRRPVSRDIRLASATVLSVAVRAFIVEAPLRANRSSSPSLPLRPRTTVEVSPGTATTTTWSAATGADAGTTTLVE